LVIQRSGVLDFLIIRYYFLTHSYRCWCHVLAV